LLLAKSQRKICNLEGTEIFHMTGVNTCLTPPPPIIDNSLQRLD
jgi:hypothetical protein